MSTAVAVSVAAVVMASLATVIVLVTLLLRRLRELAAVLGQLQARLAPSLAGIGREAQVTEQELQRLEARRKNRRERPRPGVHSAGRLSYRPPATG